MKGYRTFHWTELAALLGVKASASDEVVTIRPEDFGGKLPTYQPESMTQTQNQVCEQGWYCVGVMEDGSLNLNERSWDAKSRGGAVEKFMANHVGYYNQDDMEAAQKGYVNLNQQQLRCFDFSIAGWVKTVK